MSDPILRTSTSNFGSVSTRLSSKFDWLVSTWTEQFFHLLFFLFYCFKRAKHQETKHQRQPVRNVPILRLQPSVENQLIRPIIWIWPYNWIINVIGFGETRLFEIGHSPLKGSESYQNIPSIPVKRAETIKAPPFHSFPLSVRPNLGTKNGQTIPFSVELAKTNDRIWSEMDPKIDTFTAWFVMIIKRHQIWPILVPKCSINAIWGQINRRK